MPRGAFLVRDIRGPVGMWQLLRTGEGSVSKQQGRTVCVRLQIHFAMVVNSAEILLQKMMQGGDEESRPPREQTGCRLNRCGLRVLLKVWTLDDLDDLQEAVFSIATPCCAYSAQEPSYNPTCFAPANSRPSATTAAVTQRI